MATKCSVPALCGGLRAYASFSPSELNLNSHQAGVKLAKGMSSESVLYLLCCEYHMGDTCGCIVRSHTREILVVVVFKKLQLAMLTSPMEVRVRLHATKEIEKCLCRGLAKLYHLFPVRFS
jgi:hypothetical protein